MAKAKKDGKVFCRVEVIAQLFGVSVRRIQQLTQDGVLFTEDTPEGRRYEAAPTIQQYVAYLSDKAYGREKNNMEAELKEQKLRAEVALKESQGELHRIRTEIASGRYVSVEEVKIDYSRFFLSFKKFAMAIPSKIAGRISSLIDPVEVRRVENELQKEITKILAGFVVGTAVEGESSDGKETKNSGH